ncbi:MAG: phage tape measure protein [Herbinix sp.]|jgi:tape measure domain-containing protein|nr:phage tape measure protein [Herbinix sp.]
MATEEYDEASYSLISEADINSNISGLTKLSSVTNTYMNYVSLLSNNLNSFKYSFVNVSMSTSNLAMNMGYLKTGLVELLNMDMSDSFISMSQKMTNLSTSVIDLSDDFSDLEDNMDNVSSNGTNLSKAANDVGDLTKATDEMNEKLKTTTSETKKSKTGFEKFLKIVKAAKTGFGNLKKGMDVYDKYIKATNGLSRINDGSQSQGELYKNVSAAAYRSGVSNNDMAASVTNIGTLDTFKDNDQAIAFTELLQKSLKIDGSELNLTGVTKQLSDGLLKGDEFNALITSAPMIGEAMAEWTGNTTDELKTMAEQGNITADMLKNAMFLAGDNINEKFDELPITFANIGNNIKNSALSALAPVFERISNLINSQEFIDIVNVVKIGINLLSHAIGGLIDLIVSNWPTISVILMGIGAFLLYQLIGYLTVALPLLATNVAMWWSMNMPMLALIALFSLIIYALMSVGVTFEDIFGFIGGVVGLTVATIWNLFVGLFELLIGILNFLVNPFIEFGNFLGNLFTNPISAIVYLFQGMADSVLGIIETIANAIDAVFGSNLGDTVSGWRSSLKEKADNFVAERAPDENYQKYFDNQNWSAESFGIKAMDPQEAWTKGQSVGKNVYSTISDKLKGFTDQLAPNYEKGTKSDPMVIKDPNKDDEINVNMQDEDLSYLRKMAERDYIANIATNTLAPNISVSFGDVHETADVNQLFSRIQTILKEQIAVSPEGVY